MFSAVIYASHWEAPRACDAAEGRLASRLANATPPMRTRPSSSRGRHSRWPSACFARKTPASRGTASWSRSARARRSV